MHKDSVNPLQGLLIRAAAVRSPELGFILAADPKLEDKEVPHTIAFRWKAGVFSRGMAKFRAHTCCIIDDPEYGVVKLSAFGIYSVETKSGIVTGNVFNDARPARKRPMHGDIFSVHAIAGKAFAVGFDGATYRMDGIGEWTWIGEELPSSFDGEAIDGFSTEDVYAVGFKGAVWHYDGRAWEPLEAPTNVTLTSVKCASDGVVYIGGHKGVLLKGCGHSWAIIAQSEIEKDIWSIESFGGNLYLSTLSGVFTLNGDALEPVDFGDDPPTTTSRLSAAPDCLWSVGRSDLLSFDGRSWKRIV